MDSAQTPTAILPMQLDEHVNRITYAPENIKNGEVMPEAVSITDLEGRGFSLDRDFVPREVIEARISAQMQKQPALREQALISRFQVCQVTGIEAALPDTPDDPPPAQVEQLFDLIASPVEANPDATPPVLANPAHCHVVSRRKRSKSILRKMRHDFLLPLLQKLISVEQFYALASGNPDAVAEAETSAGN